MKPLIIGVTSATPQERGARITYSKYLAALENYYSKALPLASSFEEIEKLSNDLKQSPITFVVVCTGGTSDFVVKIAEYTIPILLSHSEQNSLASALNAAQFLARQGKYVKIIHELREDTIKEIALFSKINTVLWELRRKKIVLFGADRNWAESRYNLEFLKKLGLSFEFIGLDKVINDFNAAEEDTELIAKFQNMKSVEPKEKDIRNASKVYTLLRKYLTDSVAFGFRCFPFLVKTKVTPCLALSHALDKNITATCEADISAMIMMEISRILTGKPGFVVNLEDVHENVITVAHCTIATSLTRTCILRNHFETGYSVSIAGIVSEGTPVTVACFSPDFKHMFVSTGKIIRGSPFSEEMCRTQLKIRLNKDPKIIIEKFINRHLIVIFDVIEKELITLAKILNIKVL